MFLMLVAVLLLVHFKSRVFCETDCNWFINVNNYKRLSEGRHLFFQQNEIHKVSEVFKELEDSPIDPNDKDARYLGFPYYLRISMKCKTQPQVTALRLGHYTGLKPLVTIIFQEPVHSVRQKQEQLEIEMKGAPFKVPGLCDSEEICKMCWYTPMPFMNGTAVMDAVVTSNGLGLPVDRKRFAINVNGYVGETQEVPSFKIGKKLMKNHFLELNQSSRPLWYTHDQAPVLILGGVPHSKIVLLSDNEFEDFFSIELGIDSCWIGSVSCPQAEFSSSIVDTISTESTLFIRQNQLVYYFTGHYPILHMATSGSELWTRTMNNVCVKKLNPVFFHKNDTEYVIALGGGWQDGEFFLITVKDGIVKASKSLRGPSEMLLCDFLALEDKCSIVWAIYSLNENKFYLLVQETKTNDFQLVSYAKDMKDFEKVYHIPELIPVASEQGFVMLLGLETYTSDALIPRGLALNPLSKMFYIWGNVILQSNDMMSYVYLSNFPSTSSIKYFVLSFTGHFAFVTDAEEIWVSQEGSTEIKRVYPSKAWDVYNSLQSMQRSRIYALNQKQSLITIFYDDNGLQELVFIRDARKGNKIIKRKFPLDHVLTYDLMINTPNKGITFEGKDYIRFTHRCPFAVVRVMDLPKPQRFTRMEHYHARPPEIMDKSGFHNERTLTVYQGLIYQLLQLHSSYHRSYADPVHDPTWRWWKNKIQDAEYYSYMASNWKSSGGIYVDMANYAKIYNLRPNNALPRKIYLDKKSVFTFSVYLSIRSTKQSFGETAEENSLNYIWLTVLLSHPEYILATLERQELISRGSVLYQVTVSDKGLYPNQQLSGRKLLKTAAGFKVAHSGMKCFDYTAQGPRMKGSSVVSISLGCPPGKRLAFDITYSKNYTSNKNKRYFDCVKPDPEMPCFFFSDVFYPFFLIQDMVTGDSGRFNGSYIFKIIGGGAFSVQNIKRYSDTEILRYNTMEGSETASLIWLRADNEENLTDTQGFHVLSQASSGIVWVCQQNSPCYDIVPLDMTAPDYYFVVMVSNRGVDQTTYCDYALEFIIHVHGLRLSPTRALYYLKCSIAVVFALLVLYITICILGPKVKALFGKAVHRMQEALAFRAESSLTFSSSFTSQGSIQHLSSEPSRSSSPHSVLRIAASEGR